jgi:hypothetical protein
MQDLKILLNPQLWQSNVCWVKKGPLRFGFVKAREPTVYVVSLLTDEIIATHEYSSFTELIQDGWSIDESP